MPTKQEKEAIIARAKENNKKLKIMKNEQCGGRVITGKQEEKK